MKILQKPHLGWLFGHFWLAVILSLAGTIAQAQVAIQAVTGSILSGVEVVRIDLSEALTAVPAGFGIQSPARIALDFPNVVSAMGRSSIEVNQGNLKSVSVVQVGNRTRVVLNLKQYTAYTTEIKDKSLLIVLAAVASAAPAAAPVFAQNQSRDTQPLRDIDFRRGEDGSGRVVVSLPNNQVGVDIRQQGQTLVVEFMKTTLPEGLRRRLDVADFGTPVKTVTTFQSGDRVRMVIEPQGQWVHSAYQSDDQFVVDVKQLKIDPTKLTQGPGYSGQKLSLNFQSIEIRSLLQVIADFTIITSDSVNGAVTLRLQDVPWDQALDIILQSKGLGMRKSANVIWIAPKEEMMAKDKLELESMAATLTLEPVRTQSFQLNYADAEEIAKQLTSTGGGEKSAGRTLSTRGSASADKRTNQVFVTDVPSRLEQVNQVLKLLDVPMRQVLIEARIVEATDLFGKSLGVKFGGVDLRAQQGGDGGYSLNGSNRVAIGSSYSNAVASSGAGGAVNLSSDSSFVNLPASGLLGANAANFAVSIFSSAANRFLTLELSALESDSKGRIVASPRVITADGQQATITQGEQIPYTNCNIDDKGVERCGISFRDAALKPRITPDGAIIMHLTVNKDTRGENTVYGPAINTKNVETQVLVENGGTVVIGGIFEMAEAEDIVKVPFFGDLPGIGNLFKNRIKIASKKELLIFITPRLVENKAFR
ncbi:MAG: type IV pilus secretin PilQ [Rhodoferax sp.]|nr:type IV pilus secretin PilQ [Rhodoferax sp.]